MKLEDVIRTATGSAVVEAASAGVKGVNPREVQKFCDQVVDEEGINYASTANMLYVYNFKDKAKLIKLAAEHEVTLPPIKVVDFTDIENWLYSLKMSHEQIAALWDSQKQMWNLPPELKAKYSKLDFVEDEKVA